MPRVLLISSNSSARGGGERYLVFLAKGLLDLGIDVDILLSTETYMDGWAAELDAIGVTVHRLALKSLVNRRLRFISAMFDMRQVSMIKRFCRKGNWAGILVNQQYDEDGLDYLQGAIGSRVAPVLGVMHMPMTATKRQRLFGRLRGALLRYWYAKHHYRLILVSEGAQTEFETFYHQPRPTYVVNNGVPIDYSVVEEHATAMRSVNRVPVLGFVGQLVAQKNLDCLIETWQLLGKMGLRTNLLLVGDGPDRARLEQTLHRADKPGEWTITGWTPHPESFLSTIDVFVMSSLFEGLPLSLIEAAARGIACVIPPFNGASDVAKRASWVYVAGEHSASALADTLEKVFKDPAFDKQIKTKELELFREYFSINRMATDVSNIMGLPSCTR